MLALCAALALPASALAQGIPVRSGIAPPSTPARGITVTGSATTNIPATKVQIMLMFSTRNGALTLNAMALQPVIDALVASGVPRDAVQLPLSLGSPANVNNVTITGTVEHPTAAMVRDGIQRVGAAIATLNNTVLSSANVRAIAENCSAGQDAAHARAIADARAKATSIAAQLGVKLGPVIAVNAFDPPLQNGACVWQYYVGANMPNAPTGAQEFVSVPVLSNVQITFGIK
ncbi:MAG: SIMPL domain-containing protein [bacterium]|nr:SIMPL domain-containing protein [bacterium]